MADAASAVVATATKAATSSTEILQVYLIRALDKTSNMVDKAVDMVTEQSPILIQEVLKWYFAYNLILFVCGLAVLGLGFYLTNRVRKWIDSHDGFDYMIAAVAFSISCMVASSLINLQWLKIWIAPRLWLIEYTADLVKKGVGH